MGDRRVQAAQEPQNELRELTEDPGNWGLQGTTGLLLRFGVVLLLAASVATFFVDNYDQYNELVELSFARRCSLAVLIGSTCACVPGGNASSTTLIGHSQPRACSRSARVENNATRSRVVRVQGQWRYIAKRLSGSKLYFEETGWADGFQLEKPENTAFRDQLLYEDEVAPRVQTIQGAAIAVFATTAAAVATFAAIWY